MGRSDKGVANSMYISTKTSNKKQREKISIAEITNYDSIISSGVFRIHLTYVTIRNRFIIKQPRIIYY